MKYNNIIFLGLCLGLTTYSALSADSVIKISGRVLDYGCTVSSDSLNFTVDLQKNSARQFPTTGSTSPVVPFQITLSECSKGTTGVRVAFNGIEDAENNTLLKLDEGSNTASGLGIEILDANMRPVKLNDLHAGMQWIPLVPLQAADVTITVNGRVVAKPCTIQTKEANVNLGDLYTRNLQQPGSASGWHNITLSLTDCPVETSAVTAIVTGSTDNTGYYKNEGTAENIQIELRDDQDAALKNGDSKTVIVDEITRNAQFPLKARAITVNGNASQGTIEALINVIYTWQ
ncbi:fimbrial protein [Escherichia coli]